MCSRCCSTSDGAGVEVLGQLGAGPAHRPAAGFGSDALALSDGWRGARVVGCSGRVRVDRLASRARRAAARTSGHRRAGTAGSLRATWQEVQPTEPLRDGARPLLRVHDLRAADALQLAAGLAAAEGRPATLAFVCLDERLGAAAEREGFAVLGAGAHRRG